MNFFGLAGFSDTILFPECTLRFFLMAWVWVSWVISVGIIDYVIHTKTDKLAFTGISRWRTFSFGTQQIYIFRQVNLLVI